MRAKLFIFAIAAWTMLGLSTFSFAQMECMEHSKKAIEVGNKICPVLNEKIDEKTKVTYEYKGKIYNLCCASCVEEFKNNPGKYIEKIEKEKK